jgi:hypothetical protein
VLRQFLRLHTIGARPKARDGQLRTSNEQATKQYTKSSIILHFEENKAAKSGGLGLASTEKFTFRYEDLEPSKIFTGQTIVREKLP